LIDIFLTGTTQIDLTKLTENISIVRISDYMVVLLGGSLLLIDLIFESVHSERRWSLQFSLSL